jgi:hypothetical protein
MVVQPTQDGHGQRLTDCLSGAGKRRVLLQGCPIPDATAGSRRTAARVTRGAISLSSSSHFAATPYSNDVKPVALPTGRARLSTKPAPTGSGTIANTMGTVHVV